jgi:hypothetical protein
MRSLKLGGSITAASLLAALGAGAVASAATRYPERQAFREAATAQPQVLRDQRGCIVRLPEQRAVSCNFWMDPGASP